jgi:hypothetical protein
MGLKRQEMKAARRTRRATEKTHSEDGVDLTLIRWMLSLTPAQRLDVLEDHVRTILRMRGEAARS